MSMQHAFDEALASLSSIIAKELSEARATITKLTEEHSLKVGELRTLKETYLRQLRDTVRREVSAARSIDRAEIDELRAEIADLRRQLATRASEYAR